MIGHASVLSYMTTQSLAQLRESLEQARRIQARREAEYGVARKGYDDALKALSEEFGASSPDEAEMLLGRLHELLAKKTSLLESYMERLEA